MKEKAFKRFILCEGMRLKCLVTFLVLSFILGGSAYAQSTPNVSIKIQVNNGSTNAQSNPKISINLQNVKAKVALMELQKFIKQRFVYDDAVVDSAPNVTLVYTNTNVAQVLKDFCKQTSLSFEVISDRILIMLPPQKEKINMITLTGHVTDKQKEPLAGVAVFIKDTNYGAFTDLDGNYTLTLPEGMGYDVKVVFSMLTFQKLEIPYKKQATINAVLQENIKELNEVVITGYQNVDRRDMVGAYTSLKMDDIALPNYSSVDQMLQGQVAGMIVTTPSTRVGTSPKITIRGTSTLVGNSDPLWVVDGIIIEESPTIAGNTALLGKESDETQLNNFIGSQISWLNPNDIDNITILKDASATAIYGSRASNGVIVITTKKGNRDRLMVNYSANLSVSSRPTYSDYNVMNSQERVNFSKQAFDAGVYYNQLPIAQPYTYEGATEMYLQGLYSEEEYINRYNYLETVNTDWLKLLTQTAVSHNHNLSISGGNNKMIYTASVAYNKMEGTEKGNNQERFSGRLRVGIDLSSKLKLDLSMSGTASKTNTFMGKVSPLTYALNTSRAIPAFDEQGDPVFYKVHGDYKYNTGTKNNLTYNIQNEIDNSYATIKAPQFNANMTLKWEILPEVGYEFVAGYQNTDRTAMVFAGENTHYITEQYRGYRPGEKTAADPEYKAALLPFGGELSTDNTSSKSYNMQHKLTYSKVFNSDHRLNALAAFEIRSVKRVGKYNTVYGFQPDRGETLAKPTPISDLVPIGANKPTGWGILDDLFTKAWRSTNRTDNYLSAFATVAYAYKGRYVFNANFRHDASNRFGADVNNRFDPTYSFGAAWTISEEPFMANTKHYLDFLKLRFTYGSQGNVLANVGPDLLLNTSKPSSYYGEYYSTIKRLENPELDWERTYSWNIGADVSLFNGIVSAAFEYYLRKSDPISNLRSAYEYGYTENVPVLGTQINNQGLEATINVIPVRTKDWTVSASINLSKNWNKVTKYVENNNNVLNIATYLSGQTDNIFEKDYAVGAFWAYSFKGLDPETGYPTFNYLDGSNGSKYTDFLVYAGNSNPDITGGINLNVRYKSFGFNSIFAAVLGGKAFLSNPYSSFALGKMPDEFTNLPKELTDRWQKPGDENYTNIPGLFLSGTNELILETPKGTSDLQDIYNAWARSDARLVSKSFLRCRQIGLSWYVPQHIIKHMRIQSATLSANANNLFVLASSKYNGFDPELQTSRMPMTFSFGLNVSF